MFNYFYIERNFCFAIIIFVIIIIGFSVIIYFNKILCRYIGFAFLASKCCFLFCFFIFIFILRTAKGTPPFFVIFSIPFTLTQLPFLTTPTAPCIPPVALSAGALALNVFKFTYSYIFVWFFRFFCFCLFSVC